MLISRCLRQWVLRRGVTGALAVVLGVVFHLPTYADVWKYVDASGLTRYTNTSPGQGAELLFQSPADTPTTSAPSPIVMTSAPLIVAPPEVTPSKVPVTTPAKVSTPALAKTSAPAGLPASAPFNPGNALGDWPPRPKNLTK